jgi:methyl-accepting chemotaxis protein
MTNFMTKTLMARLVGLFLTCALVPIVLVGYLAYRSAGQALCTAEYEKLNAVRDQTVQDLQYYMAGCVNAALFLADYDRVDQALETFPLVSSHAEQSTAQSQSPRTEEQVSEVGVRLDRFMNKYLEFEQNRVAYRDVLLIRPDGYVIYTSKNRGELGRNVKTGALRDTGLAKAFEEVLSTQKQAVVDFTMYEPARAPAAFIAVPVQSRTAKKSCGVLVLRIGLEALDRLMLLTKSAGATTEMYLVRSDGTLLTKPQGQREASPLSIKVKSEAAQAALKDQRGEMISADLKGTEVFSAYSHVGLNETTDIGANFDWALLVEISAQEAMQPMRSLAGSILVIAVAIALVVGTAGVLVARSISLPVRALALAAGRIGEGDLHVALPEVKSRDELSVLANTFRTMVQSLGDQIRRVSEGTTILSSAASEISATITQVSSSASQTSAAVAETSATVEQVKQAAWLASQKAKDVAAGSREAVQISDTGRRATKDTIEKMQLIQGQVESIGETVVRLSEHSRTIEHIIGTVQDLADQSNLLAVNASIEAARAGEHGKGFAVVAQEIKALADQSRDATQRIKSILEETRKWISAVVMATEQGSKAVQVGVQHSAIAVESIGRLSDMVEASSQAASVIEASSAQQLAGVEQVSAAMQSIDLAVRQTSVSATQLEEAAGRLAALGGNLKDLVDRYRM